MRSSSLSSVALVLLLLLPLALTLLATAAPLVALVHLHPPIDYSPQSLFSRHSFVQDSQAAVSAFIRESLQSSQHELGEIEGEVEPLWIQNTLLFDRVAVRLLDPVRDDNHNEGDGPQNNIVLLHAPALWRRGVTGKGVVVASIDSGVRYSHEALRDNFRALGGNRNQVETPDTADMVGHGTHTMGTAVGGKGVGMAPGASWITARAFDMFGAANKSDFLLAAQWVVCPTRVDGSGRNCSLGADLVSNSFGIDRSSPDFKDWQWMRDVVSTWRAAGAVPVFASGNTNGFLCGSVYYPGSLEASVAVEDIVAALKHVATRDLSKPFLVPSSCGNTSYDEYPNNIYGWGLPNVCLAANELGFSCSVGNGGVVSRKDFDVVGAEAKI
ncbi:hypothetical protein PybrP1_011410, partial [[Pythium] brassicae (nom. inval.)]